MVVGFVTCNVRVEGPRRGNAITWALFSEKANAAAVSRLLSVKKHNHRGMGGCVFYESMEHNLRPALPPGQHHNALIRLLVDVQCSLIDQRAGAAGAGDAAVTYFTDQDGFQTNAATSIYIVRYKIIFHLTILIFHA